MTVDVSSMFMLIGDKNLIEPKVNRTTIIKVTTISLKNLSVNVERPSLNLPFL